MGQDKRSSQFECGSLRERLQAAFIGAGVAPLICHPLASHQILSRICVAISPCTKYCTKHFPCSLAAPNICRRGRKCGKRGSCPSPPLGHILHTACTHLAHCTLLAHILHTACTHLAHCLHNAHCLHTACTLLHTATPLLFLTAFLSIALHTTIQT